MSIKRYVKILIFTLSLTISTYAGAIMTKSEFTSKFLEQLKRDLPNLKFKKIDDLHIII